MSAKLVVVRFPIKSVETEYWLDERLREARCSELLGLAAVCMYSHNDYRLSIKGEIRRCPTMTRGLLPELDYLLAKIIRGE